LVAWRTRCCACERLGDRCWSGGSTPGPSAPFCDLAVHALRLEVRTPAFGQRPACCDTLACRRRTDRGLVADLHHCTLRLALRCLLLFTPTTHQIPTATLCDAPALLLLKTADRLGVVAIEIECLRRQNLLAASSSPQARRGHGRSVTLDTETGYSARLLPSSPEDTENILRMFSPSSSRTAEKSQRYDG